MLLLRLPRLIMLVFLLAFAVRALVPAGYMPDLHSDKAFHMVICSIDGPVTIEVDSKFSPSSAPAKHVAKDKCEFASLTHSPFAKTTMQSFVIVLKTAAIAAQGIVSDLVTPQRERYAQSQPRAPPVLI